MSPRSPRSYFITSVSMLAALGVADVALDVLNWHDIPIRVHNVLLAIAAVVVVISAGTILARAFDRGVEVGQRMRPTDLEHDTDSVVVPMPHER